MRLFVAVWPSEDAVEELRALRRKDQRGVRFTTPEQWHVTLRFLGDADPDRVGAALDEAYLPECVARLGPGVDVKGDRTVLVPVEGVGTLAGEVVRATASLGEAPRSHFLGHLTLARLARDATPPPIVGAYVAAEWPVYEIALVRSRLGPEGSRYDTIATWPTADPD
ncbi:MAG: RNA 2',3'-cyclic phosphodiesterase [Actinomycetota bacterium]